MKLSKYVISKSKLFRILLNGHVANSIYPFIFLPRDVYNKLQDGSSNIYLEALMVHEEVHRNHQKKNFLIYGLRYLFSMPFRETEEREAVSKAVSFLKKSGQNIHIPKADNIYNEDYLFLCPLSKWYSKDRLEEFIDSV
jgi:hypothetical protein